MRSDKTGKTAWLFIALGALLLMGADGDERAALTEARQTLQERITFLRAEQEYLLFRNAMYGADSKYLVFNMNRKQAFLRYKNRLLMDIRFKPAGQFRADALRPGLLVLTKKMEGKGSRYALVFGTSLIVQGKRPPAALQAGDAPVIRLSGKDLLSIFYALEPGSMAYIEP